MLKDEELALGIQQGRRDDLAALVERYHSSLVGFLYRMTGGDRSLAEDLVQETFLRLIRSIQQYQHPRPFKPWLFMIATNIARDHYKRADVRYAADMPEDETQMMGERPAQPEDILLSDAEAQMVANAVLSLPGHQREVLILRYDQELSLAEIAEIVQVPLGTVKSRLSLGLRRLKGLLEQAE